MTWHPGFQVTFSDGQQRPHASRVGQKARSVELGRVGKTLAAVVFATTTLGAALTACGSDDTARAISEIRERLVGHSPRGGINAFQRGDVIVGDALCSLGVADEA